MLSSPSPTGIFILKFVPDSLRKTEASRSILFCRGQIAPRLISTLRCFILVPGILPQPIADQSSCSSLLMSSHASFSQIFGLPFMSRTPHCFLPLSVVCTQVGYALFEVIIINCQSSLVNFFTTKAGLQGQHIVLLRLGVADTLGKYAQEKQEFIELKSGAERTAGTALLSLRIMCTRGALCHD